MKKVFKALLAICFLMVMCVILTNGTYAEEVEIKIGDCSADKSAGDNVTYIVYDTDGDLQADKMVIDGKGEMSTSWEECYTTITKVEIKEGVTSISTAFRGWSNLTSITIPNSVTRIASFAFEGCSSLSNITIPDGVTKIGSYAFEGCSSLSNITIPDSVTRIGSYAFDGWRKVADNTCS